MIKKKTITTIVEFNDNTIKLEKNNEVGDIFILNDTHYFTNINQVIARLAIMELDTTTMFVRDMILRDKIKNKIQEIVSECLTGKQYGYESEYKYYSFEYKIK